LQYRKLGNTGFEISIASAGIFQLDFVAGALDRDRFDEQLAAVRLAIDGGVNALNLGFLCHVEDPEPYAEKVRALLKEGYRQKIKIFLNVPMTSTKVPADLDACLDRQLSWFGLDFADYCLLEDLERFKWAHAESMGAVAWLSEKKAEGKILNAGFDFHDDCFFLKGVFEAGGWQCAQFRYSFMDGTRHPGFSGIKYAVDAGVGLVATDPFKGRRLLDASRAPEAVRALWSGAKTWRAVEEWALLWIWDDPRVSSVFTSFKDPDEAARVLACADAPEPLDMASEILINNVVDAYHKRRVFQCTACRCCMPCPVGVDAPRITALYNDCLVYGDVRIPKFQYGIEGLAEPACLFCGACSRRCPREYDMSGAVRKARALFA
jgi:predicted aldo/keto reductase-like oxidoreductase